MDTEAALTAFRDQTRQRMAMGIRELGVWNTYVGGDCECGTCAAVPADARDDDVAAERPPFAYTTGLHGVGHPELLVFGLSPASACGVLNAVAGWVHAGRDLVPGELVELDGRSLLIEAVPNPGEIFFAANGFYERPPEFSVLGLQLTWSDEAGRFAWEDGSLLDPADQPRPGEFRA